MTDIYVYQDSNNISVFGGSSSVDVNTGFGETGTRGSLIYSFSQDPRTISVNLLPNDLLPNDLAIIPLNNSGNFDIYQKIGTNKQDWQKLISSKTTAYRNNAVFDSSGNCSITIPLSSVVSNTSLTYTGSNFIVQLELEDSAGTPNNYPIAHSVDVNVVSANLVISVKAAKFNGTTWSSVTSETRSAHINITVI